MAMPMIYVTKETADLISEIMERLRNPVGRTDVPTRIIQADIIHVAIETYARKLRVK